MQVQNNALTLKSLRSVASLAWSGTRASGGASTRSWRFPPKSVAALQPTHPIPSLSFPPIVPGPSPINSRSTICLQTSSLPSISSLKPPPSLNHYLLIIPKIYPLFLNLLASLPLPRNISAPVPGTAGPITQACSLLFLNPRTSGNERAVSALPSYTDRITPDSTQNNLCPLHYYPILSTVR